MKKAIRLNVTLWIQGEADAASNFEQLTSGAVREIITAGASSHPELKVSIKSIAEAAGESDEEDEKNSDEPSPSRRKKR